MQPGGFSRDKSKPYVANTIIRLVHLCAHSTLSFRWSARSGDGGSASFLPLSHSLS